MTLLAIGVYGVIHMSLIGWQRFDEFAWSDQQLAWSFGSVAAFPVAGFVGALLTGRDAVYDRAAGTTVVQRAAAQGPSRFPVIITSPDSRA